MLDYEASVRFYDRMFGWLGYKSFWTLDIGYRSTHERYPLGTGAHASHPHASQLPAVDARIEERRAAAPRMDQTGDPAGYADIAFERLIGIAIAFRAKSEACSIDCPGAGPDTARRRSPAAGAGFGR
ncbi:MAG: VOC family protein [Chromatiaceae bacterium]|nr:VOC family protein [Chromatiaceae bacterium]